MNDDSNRLIISRNVGIDILRIILTFMVIIIHVRGSEYWKILDKGSTLNVYILLVYGTICSCAVPGFMMISGMLTLRREVNIKRLYKHSIPKLLGIKIYSNVTLIISCILLTSIDIQSEYTLVEAAVFDNAMWFIWCLSALYIFSPILKSIINEKKNEEYLLIIWFFVQIIKPIMIGYGNEVLNSIFGLTYFQLPEYLGYFVLGHYIYTYKIVFKKRQSIIVGVICTLGILFFSFSGISRDYVFPFNVYRELFIFVYTSTVFIICNTYLFDIKVKENIGRIINFIGGKCMYIYAIHCSILHCFRCCGVHPYIKVGGYVIGVLIETSIIWFLGLIISIIFDYFRKKVCNILLVRN